MNGKHNLHLKNKIDSRVKRLFKDIFVFAAGNASSKMILLFLMPLYTTKLTAAEYGVADTLNTLVELLVPMITLCMADAVFRFSVGAEKKTNEIAFVGGCKVVFWGLIVFALACLGFKVVFGYEYAGILMGLLTAYCLKQFLGCYLRGIGKTVTFAISGVFGTLVLVICNVLSLTVFNKGIEGYLSSIVISNGASIAIMAVAARPISIFRLNFNVPKDEQKYLLKSMVRYSLPIVPNAVSWWMNNAASKYILLFISGSRVTGLFSAAGKIPAVINLLSGIFQQAWQFSSAKEYNKEGTSEFYTKVFLIYSPFILLACSFIIMINPLISRFILRGEFVEAQCYVPLLLFSSMLSCYSVFYGGIYTAAKKSKMLTVSTLAGAVTNVCMCVIAIPRWHVYGALIANIVSYLVVVMIRVFDSKKYVEISCPWVMVAVSLFLVLIQSIVALIELPISEMLISAIIFLIVVMVNLTGGHYVKRLEKKRVS